MLRPLMRAPLSASVLSVLLACSTSTTSTTPPDPVVGSCDGCQVIRHVRVVDANGALDNRRVTMRDGLILAVTPDDGALSGATREIDGTGRTLLPGLWDLHVHLTLQGGGPGVTFPPAFPRNLMAHLYAGVTNTLDLGSPRDAVLAWRNRSRGPQLLAPRLFATGPFFTAPLGHPCNNEHDSQLCHPTLAMEDGLAWLSRLAPHAPDAVKVVVEPGLAPAPAQPSLEVATVLPALLQAARQRGFKQVVHVTRVEDALAAAAAGASALAHTPADRVMTAQEASQLAAANVAVITTLSFFASVVDMASNPAFASQALFSGCVEPALLERFSNPLARQQLVEQLQPFVGPYTQYLANAKANAAMLAASGVTLLAGTDSGNLGVFHGPALHRELALLVQAGLTPAQALAAATRAPAVWMGDGALGGLVTADATADLVMVEGNPLEDIERTALVAAVWRRGIFVPRAEFTSRAPASNLVLQLANGGANTACVDDGDCENNHACHATLGYCQKLCLPSAPATCPDGQGCLWGGGNLPGVCVEHEGCSPAAQDCLHGVAYGVACVPLDTDAAVCLAPGPRVLGDTCTVPTPEQRCAADLVCHRDGRCRAQCEPGPQAACGGAETCRDFSATYGSGVGVCLP